MRLAFAIGLAIVSCTSNASAQDSASSALSDDGLRFGLDGRYMQFSRPAAPLVTQYPFAERTSRFPAGDAVGGIGFGADVRWRFPGGWVFPIVGIAMAHSEAARPWIAPDGTTVSHDGIDLYDVGLPGIGYRFEPSSWVLEVVARPTVGAVSSTTLRVNGSRGSFDGWALAPIHVGARAELDVCVPPARIVRLAIRPCALASPAYVAGGAGSNLSLGVRLELFKQDR